MARYFQTYEKDCQSTKIERLYHFTVTTVIIAFCPGLSLGVLNGHSEHVPTEKYVTLVNERSGSSL